MAVPTFAIDDWGWRSVSADAIRIKGFSEGVLKSSERLVSLMLNFHRNSNEVLCYVKLNIRNIANDFAALMFAFDISQLNQICRANTMFK